VSVFTRRAAEPLLERRALRFSMLLFGTPERGRRVPGRTLKRETLLLERTVPQVVTRLPLCAAKRCPSRVHFFPDRSSFLLVDALDVPVTR